MKINGELLESRGWSRWTNCDGTKANVWVHPKFGAKLIWSIQYGLIVRGKRR